MKMIERLGKVVGNDLLKLPVVFGGRDEVKLL